VPDDLKKVETAVKKEAREADATETKVDSDTVLDPITDDSLREQSDKMAPPVEEPKDK
jgi:hypothetical protein